MAPEIHEGQGYSTQVDLWSLGVCMFEFMCGYLPYGEEVDDPYDIYFEIMSSKVVFPSQFPDLLARNIIDDLLQKQPSLRNCATALKKHPWFASFDWVYSNLI